MCVVSQKATEWNRNTTHLLHDFVRELLLVSVNPSTGQRVIVEYLFHLLAIGFEVGENGRGRMADADDCTQLFAIYAARKCNWGVSRGPSGFWTT